MWKGIRISSLINSSKIEFTFCARNKITFLEIPFYRKCAFNAFEHSPSKLRHFSLWMLCVFNLIRRKYRSNHESSLLCPSTCSRCTQYSSNFIFLPHPSSHPPSSYHTFVRLLWRLLMVSLILESPVFYHFLESIFSPLFALSSLWRKPFIR